MKKLYLILLTFFFTISFLEAETNYWKAEEYFENSSSQKNAASDLLQYVEIQNEDVILDVGSGDGKITAEITKKLLSGSILGIDISPAMVAFAKATFSNSFQKNLSFQIQDAMLLEYKEQFHKIFSFTTLQWIEGHRLFMKRAYQSLKPTGILAVTMPMGLLFFLEKATLETIAKPKWASYFQDFSTGWNFVKEEEYRDLLKTNYFTIKRLAVVAQKDVFPSQELFEKFISQSFPYLRPLPEALKKSSYKKL